MPKIIDHKTDGHEFHLNFRRPTVGPERLLVEDFVRTGIPEPGDGQQLTVLLEPSAGNSYPDILIIYWNKKKIENSDQKRNKFNKRDLRIFHYLLHGEGATRSEVEDLFGHRARSSLKVLNDSGITYKRGEKIFVYKKYGVGVVDRLIAIEAKVDDWRSGIHQASALSWITNETYLLITNKKSRNKIINAAWEYGVGVIFAGETLVNRSNEHRQPYGYWYVNEEVLAHKGLVRP